MSTTTLTLGTVALRGSASGAAVVGDPPQWSDESDASYAYIFGGTPAGVAEAQADPVSGNLTAWTATVRLASTPGFGSNPNFLVVNLVHPDSDALLSSDPIILPNDGATYEITVAGETEDIPDPGYNPPGWLALGPFVQVGNNSFGSRVYVYEVTVTVTVTDERATRLWPRDDALGLGAGARIYPPPRSRRLVGGQP